MEIVGNVVNGQGKGRQYVKAYADMLEKAVGFAPFHGTLNLKTSTPINFDGFEKIEIVPQEEGKGAVDAYLVIVDGLFDGAIVRPHKTTNPNDIIEIISPVNLREQLNLRTGDEISCELV